MTPVPSIEPPHVLLLCGMPTAGKTTLARHLELTQNAVRLTLDARMLAKYPYTIFDAEYGPLVQQEKELMWAEAMALLATGRSVILDWSLWSRRARAAWAQRITAAGHDYTIFYLNVPHAQLRERLTARNANLPDGAHPIPIDELDRFSHIFEPPTADEDLNLLELTPDDLTFLAETSRD